VNLIEVPHGVSILMLIDAFLGALVFLDFTTMNHRIKIWRARAYLKISADKVHLLHQELGRVTG
jgi:uncharacterized protein involved in cysteine biosynthesis